MRSATAARGEAISGWCRVSSDSLTTHCLSTAYEVAHLHISLGSPVVDEGPLCKLQGDPCCSPACTSRVAEATEVAVAHLSCSLAGSGACLQDLLYLG
jgi:hypothetical protein